MRLKILILLPRLPFPLRDGGAIAMNQTLEELIAQDCDVSVLAMNTARHFVYESDLPPIYKKLKIFKTVFIDNNISPLSAFLNLFTGKSYNVSRFVNKKFRQTLWDILDHNKFHVVWFESIYTSPYIDVVRDLCGSLCFCRVHNIEYLIWQGLCENEKLLLKKKYLELLTSRLKKYEMSALHKFDVLLPISKKEGKFIQNNLTSVSFHLPFGTSMENYDTPLDKELNSIYHLGSMDWAPNLEGVEWFLDNVWKDLQGKLPYLKLYLAGKKMPKRILDKNNAQTIIVGEVEDVVEYSMNKNIMVVPLLSGAGIRIKILEAMAMGKPIIATSIAMEGIGVTHGINAYIADTPEEFASQIEYCLNNKDETQEVGHLARAFVTANYQKSQIYEDLVAKIKHLI